MTRVVYDLGGQGKRSLLSGFQLLSAVVVVVIVVMLLIFTARAWHDDGICNESASL